MSARFLHDMGAHILVGGDDDAIAGAGKPAEAEEVLIGDLEDLETLAKAARLRPARHPFARPPGGGAAENSVSSHGHSHVRPPRRGPSSCPSAIAARATLIFEIANLIIADHEANTSRRRPTLGATPGGLPEQNGAALATSLHTKTADKGAEP